VLPGSSSPLLKSKESHVGESAEAVRKVVGEEGQGNYAGGQKVAETLIEKYKINTDIGNSVFDPQFSLARRHKDQPLRRAGLAKYGENHPFAALP
jgi:hypothetical protein